MSLHPRPKGYLECVHEHRMDVLFNDEENMSIPSVIIVPQRPCRVTSTMAQHYRNMPGEGAEISPSREGGDHGPSKSKPWEVDMAKKSYTSKRRFRRTSRLKSLPLPPPPPAPESPPVSVILCDDAPELDGSWNNSKVDDSGYPSDEENGFGGGFGSQNNSPASSTHRGGSTFGGIVLKGYYGGRRGRSPRIV